MSRAKQLELISLATNLLKATKSNSCKNFRVLSQEPLFRGICYGATKFNISSEEIEQEVSKLLKLNTPLSKYRSETSYDDKQFSVENSHIDEILPYILKFKPDEISRLPIDLQKRILNQWVVFQKGFTQSRQNEFDKVFGNAMKILNLRLVKSVSESLPAPSKTKFMNNNMNDNSINSTNHDSGKKLNLTEENDKNEMEVQME